VALSIIGRLRDSGGVRETVGGERVGARAKEGLVDFGGAAVGHDVINAP
jgi:hypothetical protein